MTWFGWIYISLILWSVFLNVKDVGKERRPTTGRVAAGVVVTQALVIWGLIAVGIRP